MKKLLIAANTFILAFPVLGWAYCDKDDVLAADEAWKDAIGANIASDVVALYETRAVLLPTFGVKIIDNQAERLKYFEKLFAEIDNLHVEFDRDRHIQFVEGGAISSGDYTFRGRVHYDHEFVESPARYTFVYDEIKNENGGCELKLITHHSSEQPFGSKITQLLAQ
jgi:hypothetical protein